MTPNYCQNWNYDFRLVEDGRTPSTLRLTVRKMSEANKYLNRESRQCPIPNSVFRNFSIGEGLLYEASYMSDQFI